MVRESIELGLRDTRGGCGCCASVSDTVSGTSQPDATTSTWQVDGMTCQHCVSSVTEELSAIPGVQRVAVDLVAGGLSTVTVESEGPLGFEAVSAAIDEAGYTLAGPTA